MIIHCPRCNKDKQIDMFQKTKWRSTGIQYACRDCENKRQRDMNRRVGYFRHKQCLEYIGGSKCKRCGITDIRVLQIDHVNGGGKKEIKGKFKGSWRKYYNHVLEDTTGKYQVLCANCNWIKKHEMREGLQK